MSDGGFGTILERPMASVWRYRPIPNRRVVVLSGEKSMTMVGCIVMALFYHEK